jgi:hypothetical protein
LNEFEEASGRKEDFSRERNDFFGKIGKEV